MSLNRAQLIGNLTRDPELRQIPGGSTVASFSIATNFTWNDQQGQKQEKAEFHNIVAWRKLAEICGQYLKKGSKVFIEGRMQTREWEGEDGVKRYRTEIVADNMIMLSGKSGGMGGGDEMSYGSGMQGQHSGLKKSAQNNDAPEMTEQPIVAEGEVTVDDLPF
ncbi:single-stranded DNA-binding protein [Candidatus Peregrinibacteria bacterium]|nr:single-stranded DNA-binding protein [Candidatus Peregrinibacteria bacterium]